MKHLLICLLCGFFPLYADLPIVSCHIEGQLGNQMFQTAATLAYAWDYGAVPIFPELNSDHLRASFNRDAIFFRLNTSAPTKPFQYQYNEPNWDSSQRIPFYPDLYLNGYFLSWKHFHHYKERILAVFAPSAQYRSYLNAKYRDLIEHPNTVAIHVRTSIRWKHDLGKFPFLGLDYYREAVQHFDKEALFVIFSDRIGWCKEHFKNFCKNIVFIEGNDHVADLFLMSKMKHLIMGSSTFSWWGAYLNQNPEAKVIVADQWMRPDFYRFPIDHLDDFYLPNWTVLHVEFGEYPEDATCYDVRSLSADDN